MQKLIERIGTESRKFELQFKFEKVFVCSMLPLNSNVFYSYRIAICRDTKIFSTDYFKATPNQDALINESVKLMATMFFETKKKVFQEKKFQILVYKKQKENTPDTEVASFVFMADMYTCAKGELQQFKDINSNKIEFRLTSIEKVSRHSDDHSSDYNSSVQKQIPSSRRKWEKKQTRKINIVGNPDMLLIPRPKSGYQIPELNPITELQNSQIQQPEQPFTQLEQPKTQSLPSYFSNKKLDQSPSPSHLKSRHRIFDGTKKQVSPSFRSAIQIDTHKQETPTSNRKIFNKSFKKRQQPLEIPVNNQNNNNNNSNKVESFEVPLSIKQNLYQIEQKLTSSRIRHETIYQQLAQQKEKEFKQLSSGFEESKKANSKLTLDLEDAIKEKQDLLEKNAELTKKYTRLVREHRELKELNEILENQNAELNAMLENNNNFNQNNNMKHSLKSSLTVSKLMQPIHDNPDKMLRQLQQLKKSKMKYTEGFEDLKHSKQLLEAKYTQLLSKYNHTFSELKIQKLAKQELIKMKELNEKKFDETYRKKQQEINQLKKQLRNLEFELMNPQKQLNQKEYNLLKQRLEKLVRDLSDETKENNEIQELLRKELNHKKKEVNDWLQKYSILEKKKSEECHLWEVKEKSLSKAMEIKDKKIAELSKEVELYKSKVNQNKSFIENQKTEILVKIQYLTKELEKRKNQEEQLIEAQMKLKEESIRNRSLKEENLEYSIKIQQLKQKTRMLQKLQKEQAESKIFLSQLQTELIKTKMKIGMIVQLVFQKNPKLFQQITEIN